MLGALPDGNAVVCADTKVETHLAVPSARFLLPTEGLDEHRGQ
jgi:hypothetical protein